LYPFKYNRITLESIPSTNKFSANRLFYILLFLHIIPLFFSKYFPTQDGPSHLKNALILKDIVLDSHSVYHHFFTINTIPNPNWFVHVFYAILLTVLPAFLVEKIFMLAYIVLIPLSFRYLVRQINPKNDFIALLIFPLIYNITFYYGFFNFCISIVFFLYTIGYWIRWHGVFRLRQLIVFILLITLTFFSHPVSFLIEGMALGFLWAGYAFFDLKSAAAPGKVFIKRLLFLVLGFLPSLILFTRYLGNNDNGIDWPDHELLQYIKDQALNSNISYMQNLDLIPYAMQSAGLALMIGYGIFMILKNKGINRLHILLLLWFIFGIIIFFAPDEFGGGSFIFMRLALYSNILAIIATAVFSWTETWRKYAPLAFFVFATLFLGIRSFSFIEAAKGLDEYLSVAKYIPVGKTFLPFTVDNVHHMPNGSKRTGDVEIYLHVSGYVSIERNAVSFENYEATYNYFPLKWKPECDVSQYFPEGGDTLRDTMINAYAQKCGVRPDYILLWGEPDDVSKKKFLLSEVEKQYAMDHLSPHGYGRLYRRK
jgi:hypothetical protein